MEERPRSLVFETPPNKEAREEEEQRHQKDVLPGAEQVEAKPPRSVDDWKCAPKIRGRVVRERRSRQKIQVGQHRVERQHEENNKRPQIVERQTCSSYEPLRSAFLLPPLTLPLRGSLPLPASGERAGVRGPFWHKKQRDPLGHASHRRPALQPCCVRVRQIQTA